MYMLGGVASKNNVGELVLALLLVNVGHVARKVIGEMSAAKSNSQGHNGSQPSTSISHVVGIVVSRDTCRKHAPSRVRVWETTGGWEKGCILSPKHLGPNQIKMPSHSHSRSASKGLSEWKVLPVDFGYWG